MKDNNIEDVYRLSPMQEGMLFHYLYSPESDIYFRQQSYTFHGKLNIPAFTQAWQRVIERHAVLRAAFYWQDLEKPLQVISRKVATPLEHQDWRHLSEAEQGERLAALLAAEQSLGFDLTRAPLMRIKLVQVADEVSHFIWSYHHLLMDGWSKYQVLREVVALYDAFCGGKDLQLVRPRPYRDYISWLKQQDASGAEAFWRESLKGFDTPTPLGASAANNHGPDPGDVYDAREILLPANTTAALKSLARQHQLTLNTLVQGAWSLLLSRYSGEEDVLFGITVSGRPASLPGVENMVGLFINTLPMRVEVPREAELLPWLKKLQAQQAELSQFEHNHLSDIHGWSEVPRGQKLFESLLVFDNFPVDESLRAEGQLRFKPLASVERNNYPLTLVAYADEQLMLRIPYDTQRFGSAAIERMLGHLRSLLEGMIFRPQQRLSEVPLLPREERQRLLSEWNNAAHDLSSNLTIHELFEAQVGRTPDATALLLDEDSLTYRQLNERANQLAHYLRGLGVGPEVRVGICVERSLEMLVGLLGTLKAGGVYVPLDPGYPQERLSFLLEDLQVPVLLTQDHLLFELPTYAVASEIVCLDSDWGAIASGLTENPENFLTGENLAYIIYTSGSTGSPKGVCLSHAVAANHFIAAQREFRLDSADVVLEFASFNFDVSLEQIFVPLLAGATVVLRGAQAWGREDFFQHVADFGLTVVNFPPAYWTQVVPAPGTDLAAGLAARLKLVIIGGDQMPAHTARLWQQSGLRDVRLLNAYGPTETVITATTFTVPLLAEEDTASLQIPIGRPLAHRAVYILDRQGEPVPVGVTGELHIGGPLLARGYLNLPALTAERFVPDPFSGQAGARMYRTGDQAAYAEDGNIRFLGRVDNQVKIRGYRIELGEVEAALYACEGVRDAAVIVSERVAGEKQLIGYVVMQEGTTAEAGEVKERLRERLPDYMIPNAFVALDEMPLTPNGKVDRRALPAPDDARAQAVDSYQAPRTPVEEMLANIFAEVLRVARVGVEDNFFELGGHSLLATQVISRIRESLDVELPVRAVFEHPTAAGLATQVEAESHAGYEAPPLVKREDDGAAPLSFAQQRLWFLDSFEPQSNAYNMRVALRLKGLLNVGALESTLAEVRRRHEVLRTRFAVQDGEPVQVIDAPTPFSVSVTEVAEEAQEQRVRQLIEEEGSRPFDLAAGPLVRAQLLRLAAEEHVLLFTMHHIISDGWSMGVLIKEVAALYNAYANGAESPLAELPIQYADFAHWQRGWLQGEALSAQLDYWRDELADAPVVIDLPTDKPRPPIQTFRGASHPVRLSPELSAQLRDLSRRHGSTLFMTLLAAFDVLMCRYAGQEQALVGTPIANRNRSETEGLIGFFVNTLVLRGDVRGNPSFTELLRRVKETALGAYAHQDLPFEKLVEELHPERDMSRSPLFQVMFVLQNAPGEALELEGLSLSGMESAGETAKFELMLRLQERGEEIVGGLNYNRDLYEAETVRRMVEGYERVLRAVVEEAERRVLEIELLSEEERRQIIEGWNETAAEYPRELSLSKLFEAQAERTPEAVALIFEDTVLSYRELNERANQLARYLQRKGVGTDLLVGILMKRSVEMIVAVLGILKAGGAYVPLDPTYPAERLAFMIKDAGLRMLLTQELAGEVTGEHAFETLSLNEQWDSIAGESVENVESDVRPQSLAYVIYTSGSTGRPKGVMIQQRSVVNLASALRDSIYQKHGAGLRVGLSAPLAFDASVKQLVQLLHGHTLCILPDEARADAHQLLSYIKRYALDTLDCTPSHLKLLGAGGLEQLLELAPKLVLVGGEALDETVWPLLADSGETRFFNIYGPTECTVDATVSEVRAGLPASTIGRPLPNVQVYLLDRRQQPVGIGIPGEIYIGGAGVGRGYLHQPGLTAERFIPHPYSDEGGARLYRTGDVGRYLPDGNIEHLGRLDAQVKVRGFRIELGEIEAVLASHPAIREAVVVVKEDKSKDKRLVAYAAVDGEEANGNALRGYLRERVPEYMVPSAFVLLDSLPLTPNGKIDRHALPAPEDQSGQAGHNYMAARTPVEELLANIFSEVLGLEMVGTDESFFNLGGHSLLATKVIARVREAFRVDVALRALFERPTVAELARHLEDQLRAGKGMAAPSIKRVERNAMLPLSFAQQRLWFFEQFQPGSTTYNLLQSARLLGALNVTAFEQSLNEILRRHESLRTTFQTIKGEPVQEIAPPSTLTLPLIDLSARPEAEREKEVQRLTQEELNRPFDLARGPLVRARLLKLDEHTHVALFVMHHIVTDAWSMGVLLRELQVLYDAFSQRQPSPLAELPVQYADFAHWQREWLSGEVLEEQFAYWKERLGGQLPVLSLPTDRPRPEVWTYRGAKHPVQFSKNLTEELKALGSRQGATLFMTLLAAFQMLLHYYTGEEDIVVGTDDANRGQLETEALIGFFINQLALRTDLSGNPSFNELLARVREVTLGAYANHDLPFDKIIEKLRPERSLSHAPLFQVKLVLQNTPAKELELRGLKLLPLQTDHVAAKFDLTQLLWEKPEGLRGWIEYSSDLFSAQAVARIAGQFEVVLESIAAAPDITLGQLREVLAEDERKRRAREQKEREAAQRSKFKTIKPKAVSLSEQLLVQTSELRPGERLPLVIQPATNKLDLEEWTKANLSFIEGKLHQHGALLFRGFAVDSASTFEKFAHAICPQLFDENGEHQRDSVSGKIYTPVAYPSNKLLLWHNENSFNNSWPMKIWFCCANPATEGGETPLVDSRRVFEMLDPKIRERFIQKQVMYVRNYKEGLGQSWQAIMRAATRAQAEEYCRKNLMEFEWKEGNGLVTRCVRPAASKHPRTGEMVWFNQAQHWHPSCLDAETRDSLRAVFGDDDLPRGCYYGDGSVIEDSVMEEILEVYRQLEVSFPWQARDIVMLDNMLTAHGRNPYVGERRLYVAMGEMTSYADIHSTEAVNLQMA